MIDKDNSGTLTKTEIVFVSTDNRQDFLPANCGEPNLCFCSCPLVWKRAWMPWTRAGTGELDMDECAGAASCSYFSSGRLNACSMAWRYACSTA